MPSLVPFATRPDGKEAAMGGGPTPTQHYLPRFLLLIPNSTGDLRLVAFQRMVLAAFLTYQRMVLAACCFPRRLVDFGNFSYINWQDST
jgi:hypothetical protein